MAAQAQRIADLERELAELRREFYANTVTLEIAFAAGRASITDPRPVAPARPARHLHAVRDLEPEPELEAGA